MSISRKKSVGLILFIFILILASGHLNRRDTVNISGTNIESFYRWGEEYVHIKDICLLGFRMVREEENVYIDYDEDYKKMRKQMLVELNDTRNKFRVFINGVIIDYCLLNGEIAVSVNALCDFDYRSINKDNPQYKYYTAFSSLGYSPYWFRKNADKSVSFLPLEEKVNCNMGEVKFVGMHDNYQKNEMQNFFSLEIIMEELETEYEIDNNCLDIRSFLIEKKKFWKKEEILNISMIGYPVLQTKLDIITGEEMSAIIDRGVLKVNIEEFAKIYGFNCNKEYKDDFVIFSLSKMS